MHHEAAEVVGVKSESELVKLDLELELWLILLK